MRAAAENAAPRPQAARDDDVVARHRELMFPWVKPYYGEPLVLESGQGVRVRSRWALVHGFSRREGG